MSDKPQATSLIEAAKRFTKDGYEHSQMRKLLISLVHHKEATRVLLKEMQLIAKDLS